MVYYIIKRGSKRILGRDIRPHELRHCRATELLERGASVHWIKTYLGHSSIAITEIYLHQSDEQNLKNIEKILKT
jgi:integrase/recombinase XerD